MGSYVFIDGRDEKQLHFALEGSYKKVILTGGDLIDLVRKYHRRFYFAGDALIDRLRIKRVPAVVEQEGGLVRVTEKKMD